MLRSGSSLARKWPALLAVFAGIIVASEAAGADTRYVADVLIITMREGKGAGAKIKNLKTNTPVEVLEESGRYLKVKTEDGSVGWVHGQYVTPETPKPIVIAELTRKVEQLQRMVSELQKDKPDIFADFQAAKIRHAAEVKELDSQLSHFRQEAERTAVQLAAATDKYDTLAERSQNVAELIDAHEKLKREYQRMERDISHLRTAIARPRPPAMFWWFLAGGALFLGGLVAGALFRKKKYYIDL